MCLDTATKIEENPLIQSGWKTFGGTRSSPEFETSSLNGSTIVPLDKWISAEGDKIRISAFKSYPAGFHVFDNERECSKIGFRRVYYRNAHTKGTQEGKSVIVAREIFVPSNPDDWPPKEN